MRPFESLLPHIERRIAASDEGGEAGRIVRLDNDLYFRPVLMPGPYYNQDSLRFNFHLFFQEDGSHAVPAFRDLGELLKIHLGYDVTFPGGILGSPLVRQELRRLKEFWDWPSPSLTLTRVKTPRQEFLEAPRCWSSLGFFVRPDRRAPPDGYNWANLGSEIVKSADDILRLLETTRPREHSQALQPH